MNSHFDPAQTLVHIVPAVPPAFEGLSDYCRKLWQHWPAPRPAWTCLAARVPPGAAQLWPEADIRAFDLSKNGLLEALEATHSRRVVLHYVGYAYQKKGVPLWLPGALRAYKRRHRAHVCVMFHELYASGSPRQSAFWLAPLAFSIVSQLAELADSWITSSEAGAAKLTGEVGAPAARGRVVPIGTAIEPQFPTDWERAWPLFAGEKLRLAIFGLPANRAAAARAHHNLLRVLSDRNLLESVALIGKADEGVESQWEELQRHAPAVRWLRYPDLAPAEVSRELARSHAALTHYPPDLLTKSSVYPAFCAHGLLTICSHQRLLPAPAPGAQRLGFEVPHLSNDDQNAAATARALQDQNLVSSLRAAVRRVAQNELSWETIARAWTQATALDA